MQDGFLVLNVVEANVRYGRDRQKLYFSLDHKHVLCIKSAGYPRMRVRVMMRGEHVDEFMKKLGIDGQTIQVCARRQASNIYI